MAVDVYAYILLKAAACVGRRSFGATSTSRKRAANSQHPRRSIVMWGLPDHRRSPQISREHRRSPQINRISTADNRRSVMNTADHRRSPQITHELRRSNLLIRMRKCVRHGTVQHCGQLHTIRNTRNCKKQYSNGN